MAGKEHEDKEKAPEGEETKKSSKLKMVLVMELRFLQHGNSF